MNVRGSWAFANMPKIGLVCQPFTQQMGIYLAIYVCRWLFGLLTNVVFHLFMRSTVFNNVANIGVPPQWIATLPAKQLAGVQKKTEKALSLHWLTKQIRGYGCVKGAYR